MDPRKLSLLEEILSHLKDSQAGGLKSLLDEENKPALPEGVDGEEALETPGEESLEDKISSLDKPEIEDKAQNPDLIPGEEEMSDDELSELVKKFLS